MTLLSAETIKPCFQLPIVQNVQKIDQKFVPHHRESNKQEVPCFVSDSLYNHSIVPCVDRAHNYSYTNQDFAHFCIP